MILSKKGLEILLERIMSSGELTPQMETDIQRLKDDYDERMGILSKYGESYDGEDEEYDFIEREMPDYEGAIAERDKYKKAYFDRFFGREEMKPDEDLTPKEIEEEIDDDATEENEAFENIEDLIKKG